MLTKIIALSCLLAGVLAAPQEEVVPASAVLPAVPVAETILTAGNCKIETENLETQVCTPRAVEVCDTIEVPHEKVEFEKRCKDVTSRHCAGVRFVKREAEAEPYYGYGAFLPASYAYTAQAEVEPNCHEITATHCLDHPEPKPAPEALKRCHLVQKVDCTPTNKPIAKTICEPVQQDLRSAIIPGASTAFVHPFAYRAAYTGY